MHSPQADEVTGNKPRQFKRYQVNNTFLLSIIFVAETPGFSLWCGNIWAYSCLPHTILSTVNKCICREALIRLFNFGEEVRLHLALCEFIVFNSILYRNPT